MRQRHLVVMVKEPRPGRVKTRLGQGIGMVEAAWWFRHQMARTFRAVQDPRWTTTAAITPDRALGARVWPRGVPQVPQGPGDLGDRMARLFRSMPPGPVCIVGADIPGMTAPHIARAFAALGHADAVFGPAEDGGFWLVGLARRQPVPAGIFENVRWSTPHALRDSEASLAGLRLARCDTLSDVDTAADLAQEP